MPSLALRTTRARDPNKTVWCGVVSGRRFNKQGMRSDRSYWEIMQDVHTLHTGSRKEAMRRRCEALGQGGNHTGGQPDEPEGLPE